MLSDLKTPPLQLLKRYFSDLVKTYGQKDGFLGA